MRPILPTRIGNWRNRAIFFRLQSLQRQFSTSTPASSSGVTLPTWPLEFNTKIQYKMQAIEEKWNDKLRRQFEESKTRKSVGKESRYILPMFPYPSGALHMGHMRVYTISDATARYYRLNGFEVIHPMGWDAFGLPAENAARDHGQDPREWTNRNIATMKEQLLKTGALFDWEREIFTCQPEFYRWTQWIFLQLHRHGLVKRTFAEVNWDPVDGTVLAAEQIDSEGRSWRSGAKAEKKKLRQWMVETPKYAKRLSLGLEKLHQWGTVADYQANWIGICDAYRFMLPMRDSSGNSLEGFLDLRLLHPEDIVNAGFIVVRQGHPLSDVKRKGTREPYLLPLQVLNGVTGDWLQVVVVPQDYDKGYQMLMDCRVACMDDLGIAVQFDLSIKANTKRQLSKADIQEIAAFGNYGGYETSRTLQDWVVSRQRAWGTPIPMYLSENDLRAAPVDLDKLPIIQGSTQNAQIFDHPELGKAKLDSDTLDTFFDSSWYYLRYLDPHNSQELASKEALKQMPVNVYIGGIEHAAVHMFFARFIAYFLRDIGVTTSEEPFSELIPQGIVRGRTFTDAQTGRYLRSSEVVKNEKGEFTTKDGQSVNVEYEKMSKSKNNGVDPLLVLERDGIDMCRLQLLHASGPRQIIDWGEFDTKGLRLWIDRVGKVVSTYVSQRMMQSTGNVKETGEKKKAENLDEALRETYNTGVRATSMSIEVMHMHNLAIMRLISLTNALMKIPPEVFGSSVEAERCVEALVVMLQIFTPNLSAELWQALSQVPRLQSAQGARTGLVTEQPWPQIDTDANVEFVLVTNGVTCHRIWTPRQTIENLSIEELIERSKQNEHAEFYAKLEERRLQVKEIRLEKRKGLHVALHLELTENVQPGVITLLLNEIHDAKRKKTGKKRTAENDT